MKEKKCDRKTAELIYENEKLKKIAKKQGLILPSFGVEFPNIPSITGTGIPKDVQNDNDIQDLPLPDKEIKMEEIIIDDTQIENSSDDENFWS